jgi:hypothetical protein
MSIQMAIRQFQDNVNRGGATLTKTDPEKYNLYSGLVNMAKSIENIENEVQWMKAKVARMAGDR